MSPDHSFKLLVSVRYDEKLLGPSAENTAIFSDVHDQPYPPVIPPSTPQDAEYRTPVYLPHLHQRRLIDAVKFFNWHENSTHLLEDGLLTSPGHFDTWIRKRVQDTFSGTVYSNGGLQPLKLRILLSSSGGVSLEASPVPAVTCIETFFPVALPPPDTLAKPDENGEQGVEGVWPGKPSWSIGVDTLPIPSAGDTADPHLHFKTTRRDIYTAARSRMRSTERLSDGQSQDEGLLSEILLYSEAGFITEGSLTSIYFWRNGVWITPRTSSAFTEVEGEVTRRAEAGAQAGTTRSYALAKGFVEEGDVRKDSIIDGEAVWLSNGVRGFGWGFIRL